MPWAVDHCQSLIHLSVSNFSHFFLSLIHLSVSNFSHFFDISIRIISMLAIMEAIWKVFNCYLLQNCKRDGAETWWKASGYHGDLELLKWFSSDIQAHLVKKHAYIILIPLNPTFI